MRIRNGNLIRHFKFLDVAFEIFTATESGDEITVHGRWLNQGFVETYELDYPSQTFNIKKSDMHKWSICTDPKAKCIRYTPWVEATI